MLRRGDNATCFVAVFLALSRSCGVIVAAPPALAFVLWYLLIGHTAPETWADAGEYLQLPLYVWTGLSGAVGGLIGIPGARGLSSWAHLLLAPFVVRNVPDSLRHLAWAGAAAALLQMILTGIARMKFGVENAVAGRYAYLIVILLLPSLALCVLAFRAALVRRGVVPLVLGAASDGGAHGAHARCREQVCPDPARPEQTVARQGPGDPRQCRRRREDSHALTGELDRR